MSVTIVGKRGYSGKVEKKINLVQMDLAQLDKEGSLVIGCYNSEPDDPEGSLAFPEEQWYCKGGAVIGDLQVGKVMHDVWVDGEGMEHQQEWIFYFVEGRDYTLKYTDNDAPGKKATLTVAGTKKGCLKGLGFGTCGSHSPR